MTRACENKMTRVLDVASVDFETGEVVLRAGAEEGSGNSIGRVSFRNGGCFDIDEVARARKMAVTIEAVSGR